MSLTVGYQPILNGASVIVNQFVGQIVLAGTTSYCMTSILLDNNGSVIGDSNPLPVLIDTASTITAEINATSTVTAEIGNTVTAVVKPTATTLHALDAAIVHAGTNCVALNAGHALAGGFIVNLSASDTLVVNQIAAAGTILGGSNIPIYPGAAYNILPSANAVNVQTLGTTDVDIAGYGQV